MLMIRSLFEIFGGSYSRRDLGNGCVLLKRRRMPRSRSIWREVGGLGDVRPDGAGALLAVRVSGAGEGAARSRVCSVSFLSGSFGEDQSGISPLVNVDLTGGVRQCIIDV